MEENKNFFQSTGLWDKWSRTWAIRNYAYYVTMEFEFEFDLNEYLNRTETRLWLRDRYKELAEQFQDSDYAPRALYRRAVIGMYTESIAEITRFNSSIDAGILEAELREISDKYPESNLADDAAFWSVCVIKDNDRRKDAYLKWLDDYPDSDIMDRAREYAERNRNCRLTTH